MSKKKLTIVYHWFPHYRKNLFYHINKAFDLKLIGDNKSNYNNLSLMSLKNYTFHKVNNIWIGPFLFQKGLISFFRKDNNKNYIFLADWKFISNWIIIIFFKGRKNIYGWTHGISKSDSSFLILIKKIYYRLFDKIITYNEEASEVLNNLKITAIPIYNSLDRFDNFQIKTGYEKDWIFVGRILRERLIEEFLIEMSKNKSNLGSIVFHIIGPCDFKDELIKNIQDLGLSNNVILYGEIYEFKEILKISKSCKYFIHPSDVGLAALLSLSLNLDLYTHNKISNHKPEIEAVIQAKKVTFFNQNSSFGVKNLIRLINLSKPSSDDYQMVKEVLDKWSVQNQIEILNNLLDVKNS